MKIKYNKKELNLLTINYLLELKKIKWYNNETTKELEQIINQYNDRLERQARSKK